MKTRVLFVRCMIIALIFNSCGVESVPIEYGLESCHFCQMTIVDKQYAAEIVTKKGKVFKFDATECMINYRDNIDTSIVGIYLSTDYMQPEHLINAKDATFLISENLPSPMGMYLTAFKNGNDANIQLTKKGGELHNWNELLLKFQK